MVALFLPEPERKVVPMNVCNAFGSDSIHDHVMCSYNIGFYLFERQIKAATCISGQDSGRFLLLIAGMGRHTALPTS